MDHTGTIASIDADLLTDLVRRLTSIPTAKVTAWTHSQLHDGGGDAQIYRWAGTATTPGGHLGWSLVVKVFAAAPADAEPSDWDYPHREILAYRSGLLDDLQGSVIAPRCIGIHEQADGTIWLWLEEVVDGIGAWTLDHYGVAAYHLGLFNGRSLADQTLPDEPWLSRRWLRGSLDAAAPTIAEYREVRHLPIVQRVYGSGDAMLQLWDEHERWLDVLERLPQTFCHLDAFKRNLFAGIAPTGKPCTVAIDWSFAGIAAVGEEIATLVASSVAFSEVAVADVAALEATVMAGYLRGLRDAGYQADPQQVRLAYCITSALRLPIGAMPSTLPYILEARLHTAHEQRADQSVLATFDMWGEMLNHQFALGDEARRLIAAMSLERDP